MTINGFLVRKDELGVPHERPEVVTDDMPVYARVSFNRIIGYIVAIEKQKNGTTRVHMVSGATFVSETVAVMASADYVISDEFIPTTYKNRTQGAQRQAQV